MRLRAVLLFLSALVGPCYLTTTSTRVYYARCDYGGFSCALVDTNKHIITYQCPVNVNDVTFYLWNFRSPPTTQQVIIENCSTVRLSFACSGENKPITALRVINVTNLIIIPSYLTHNPPIIELTNIDRLEFIPENTFSQIKQKTYKPNCFNPIRDLETFRMVNVSIGTIESGAFGSLKDLHNFTWTKVNVERIQHNAISVHFNKSGNFSIEESRLEVLEPLAFKISGKSAHFKSNSFIEMSSFAINGTIGKFDFVSNTVDSMESHAISILSQDVKISDNRFGYLHSGAFDRISPGLLENSQMNFGALKFVYNFNHNSITFMDAACLNPDVEAYNNVATDMSFVRNALLCSCDNLGWLLSEVGHGYSTQLLQEFYESVIDEGNKNFCLHTVCEVLLKKAEKMVLNGKCVPGITAEQLCTINVTNKHHQELKRKNSAELARTNSAQKQEKRVFLAVFCIFVKFFLY